MYSVRGKEADNMKRYKVEMQREGSVKYFFIRDMETLENRDKEKPMNEKTREPMVIAL